MNNYLPIFPGSSAPKKITPEELNNIFLHTVPNVWAKQGYLKGWDFQEKTYKETCNIFERMDISAKVYEGETPYKTTTKANENCASHGRELKGGEAI